MATTSRKSKTDTLPDATPETVTHYLTAEELSQLKEDGLRAENRHLQRGMMGMDVNLLVAQAEIARQKSEVVRHRLLLMKSEHEEIQSASRKRTNALIVKYGGQEGDTFGYDPESGEVKITSKDRI